MTDDSVKKLRSLLKSFGDKASQTPTDPLGFGSDEERRRRECGDVLRQIARPVLERFAQELNGAGHDASVQDTTDRPDTYPSVALTFTPRAPGATALASMVTFRYDPRRGVLVQRDIKAAAAARGRAVTGSTDRIGTMKVDGLSESWVATKTLSFVEAVLKAN
jgi:hypothetical protein